MWSETCLVKTTTSISARVRRETKHGVCICDSSVKCCFQNNAQQRFEEHWCACLSHGEYKTLYGSCNIKFAFFHATCC